MTRARRSLLAWAAVCIAAVPFCESFAGESLPGTAAASRTETAENMDYSPPSWPEAPETGALLTRLAAGTATVLVLCVLTLIASRRWLTRPAPKTGDGSELQLMESVSLGGRCCVHLLRAGRHQIVVGVDGSGLKSLIALPESFEKSLSEAESHETLYTTAAAEQVVSSVG